MSGKRSRSASTLTRYLPVRSLMGTNTVLAASLPEWHALYESAEQLLHGGDLSFVGPFPPRCRLHGSQVLGNTVPGGSAAGSVLIAAALIDDCSHFLSPPGVLLLCGSLDTVSLVRHLDLVRLRNSEQQSWVVRIHLYGA